MNFLLIWEEYLVVFLFILSGCDSDDVLDEPNNPSSLQPEERLTRTRSRRGGNYTG